MMESILTGIFINIITEISKKYNISQTLLIGWICILMGFLYIWLKEYNPDLLEHSIKYVLESLWVSQWLYMAYTKLTK